MCGLVGMLDASNSGFTQKDKDLFFGLMLINSLRGSSSTGLIGINKHKQGDILKVLGNPYNLFKTGLGHMFMDRMVYKYWAVIGHGRFPTQGEVNVNNAHPFVHKHISLVHNGTLTNLKTLNTKYNKSFDVDSEMICWLISEYGLEKTIDEIDGAYALMFYNSEEDSYNIIRNGERPLWYGLNGFEDKMVIGSEKNYIVWADSKHFAYKTIKEFDTHKHYKITKKLGKLSMEVTECRKIYKSQSYSRGGYGGYSEFYDDDPPVTTRPINIIQHQSTPNNNKEVIICKGEDMIFEVVSATESKVADRPPITLLQGYHEDSLKIKVIAETDISADEVETKMVENDQMFMIGEVEDIIVLQENNKIETKVYIKNPKLYEKGSKVVQINKHDTKLTLRNGEKISRKRYAELSSNGCQQCNSVVLFTESHRTSMRYDEVKGQGLICGDCYEKAEKGEANGGHQKHKLH